MFMHQTPYFSPATDQAGGHSTRFCPHCGHPVSATDAFCQNCGYNLKTEQAAADQIAQDQAPKPKAPAPAPQPRRPRRPWTKRRKLLWGLGGVVAVALIAGIAWGQHYYSKEATLNRAIADIRSGRHLTRELTSSSTDLKLTTTNLIPLNRYYRAHQRALNQLQAQLLSSGSSQDGNFTYRETGRHWLLFPKYQISVSPVYPTVTTNHRGTVISLDHQTVATATSNDYRKKLTALVPGEYHLQASGKVGSHQLTNSSDYHITRNQAYDLDLTTVSVTVNTASGSAILLNGKKIGTADGNGTYALKDEPWSDNMTLSAQYVSSAGTAKTRSVTVAKHDDGTTVNLDYPDLIDSGTADDFFSDLFTAVQNLADNGDMGDATDDDGDPMSDFFENGESNADFAELKQMAKGYYHDDHLDAIGMDTDVKSVAPGPNGTSLVTYTVKYDFGLTDEDYDHIQTFQYTATVKDSSSNDDTSQINQVVKISPAQKLNDYHDDDD
ncbi:zinc ribbon domain-containing protein [Levilactobacillus zymae]|uniref:zinc ribbon domain-containing protein n=1 Tax=Levilactobacillus zymae TaxID=267363 RepID=UPI001E5B228D|nr:zinc ribbon domain-containing protein [Levilactobacillus zymae]